MTRFSILEYFVAAKQIMEIQGPHLFSKKLKGLFFAYYRNEEIIKTIKKFSSDYKIFIDIGSKFGIVISDVAKNYSQSLCFEPFPQNYKKMTQRLKDKNLDNIITYQSALGEKKGSQKLFLSPNNPGQNRLNIDPNENWNSIEVSVTTLDDILNDLGIKENCVIKVDVEGYELNVLKGAEKTLQRDCVIISEFWPYGLRINNVEPSEYVNYMKSFDYSFFDLSGKSVSPIYFENLCKQNKRFVTDDFVIKKI